MNIFMGIDIGKKGGICIIGKQCEIILLEEFPNNDYVMPMRAISVVVREFWTGNNIYLVKESPLKRLGPKIGGSYGRGISIGINIGIWEYWLNSNPIEWIDKQAREWQKIFPEFQRKGGKERSEAAALREIPACQDLIYGPRGGLKDGLTDAILISIFCKLLVDRGMFR